MIDKPEDILLREEDEVQYLLGKPPEWILRRGTGITMAGAILAIVVAWFIRYPDVVTAPVSIVTDRPAIRLVSVSGGTIADVLVKEKDQVAAGDVLICIDNPANWEHVLALEQQLDAFLSDSLSSSDPTTENLLSDWELGSMQSSYSEWLAELEKFLLGRGRLYSIQSVAALRQQIKDLQLLNSSLQQQEETAKKEMELAELRLTRSEAKFKQGAIKEPELQIDKEIHLDKKSKVEALQTEQLNNQVKIGNLRKELADMGFSQLGGMRSSDIRLQELTRNLKSEILFWKQNHLVMAPVDGIVSLASNWTNGQYLQPGQEVVTLLAPEGQGNIHAQGLLPTTGAGKVAQGMSVRIRLAGFPYKEYGVLTGHVRDIALAPVSTDTAPSYRIDIELPDGLKTNYDRSLPLLRESQGTAYIITERRNLLQRLFEPLYSAMKNN
jgi:multidrug resistance efflux pump